MAYLISYQKASDQYTQYVLDAPEGSTELCTISGTTYVSIPDGEALGPQPEAIQSTIAPVTLTEELLSDIEEHSPHVRLIRDRVKDKISLKYSITDEIKLIRTTPGEAFDVYNTYMESCREWGRAEKEKLGLYL